MMTQERKNQLCDKMLSWVFEHVKNDKELFRILHEEFGMTKEEFHDSGIDSLDYLFEAKTIEDTVGKIAVIHLHQGDEDNHFVKAHDNTFFRIAKLYQRFYETGDANLTIDSIALSYFGAEQFIEPLPFSILVDACENDDRVNVVVEIDMDEGMMSVKDKSGEWRTYCLEDIIHALEIVERNVGRGINPFSDRMFQELMEWNHVNVIKEKSQEQYAETSDEQIPAM